MHKTFALFTLLFFIVSCHSDKHPVAVKAREHHFRLNPPDSSNYRYNTTIDAVISIVDKDSTHGIQRTSRFTTNYLITRDSDEYVLEMTFGKLDYHEKELGAWKLDIADVPGPARDLLDKMKTATIFGRVHPTSTELTMGGAQEIVNKLMSTYYSPENEEQEGRYWGHWLEQEFVWRNFNSLIWIELDSAAHVGDIWADTATKEDYINYKVCSHFQFEKLDANIATFRSHGRIANDPRGTYVWGNYAAGKLMGTENGKSLIDTATGLPIMMEDTINSQSDLRIEGREARITIIQRIRSILVR